MTVAIPAANTSVMPTSWTRRWKLVAKYAGSITEMQHGSATTPPRNAVITVPDRWGVSCWHGRHQDAQRLTIVGRPASEPNGSAGPGPRQSRLTGGNAAAGPAPGDAARQATP